jgi:hypothetical protein
VERRRDAAAERAAWQALPLPVRQAQALRAAQELTVEQPQRALGAQPAVPAGQGEK